MKKCLYCNKEARAGRGMCGSHYGRWWRYGDPFEIHDHYNVGENHPKYKDGRSMISIDRMYRIYLGMKERCYNSNNPGYKNYGGRGISICDRWLLSYENFVFDMSNGYDDNLTIERIDNDGPYSKENCTWIPFEEQAKNRDTGNRYKKRT